MKGLLTRIIFLVLCSISASCYQQSPPIYMGGNIVYAETETSVLIMISVDKIVEDYRLYRIKFLEEPEWVNIEGKEDIKIYTRKNDNLKDIFFSEVEDVEIVGEILKKYNNGELFCLSIEKTALSGLNIYSADFTFSVRNGSDETYGNLVIYL